MTATRQAMDNFNIVLVGNVLFNGRNEANPILRKIPNGGCLPACLCPQGLVYKLKLSAACLVVVVVFVLRAMHSFL